MPAAAPSRVWLKTALVLLAYAASIGASYRFLTASWFSDPWLSIAVAFAGVQAAFAAVILFIVFLSRTVALRRVRRGLPVLPELRACFAAQAAGHDQTAKLKFFLRRYPREFQDVLFEFLSSLRGVENSRLRKTASDMGMVRRWMAMYGSRSASRRRKAVELLGKTPDYEVRGFLEKVLDDEDESIRLTASRALIAAGNRQEIERIFQFALRQPPVVRAVVAEDLRRRMPVLAEHAIPAALQSGDNQVVLAALDIIWSCGRVVNIPAVAGLIDSDDAVIRAVAIHAVLYSAAPGIDARIAEHITDNAAVVRRAAAAAAGRRRIKGCIPLLLPRLQDRDERVAVAAARAIAEMGEEGLAALEKEVVTGAPAAASCALEALEKARVGRTDWE